MTDRTDSLNVIVTDDCNLSCPWCIRRESMVHKGTWTPQTAAKFAEYISANSYDRIVLTGGEPLLYPDVALGVIRLIREASPKSNVMITTNGTTLTLDLAEKLQDAFFNLALQGGGYKGVTTLLKNASKPGEVIAAIQKLRHCFIRSIVFPDSPDFAEEAMMLHAMFPGVILQFGLDRRRLGEYGLPEFIRMQREINRLRGMYPDCREWLGFERIPRRYKSPDNAVFFNFDGTLSRPESEGWAEYEFGLKPGLYEVYRDLFGKG